MTKQEEQDLRDINVEEYQKLNHKNYGYRTISKFYGVIEDLETNSIIVSKDELNDEQRLHVGLAGTISTQLVEYQKTNGELLAEDYEGFAKKVKNNASYSNTDLQWMGDSIPNDLEPWIQVIKILNDNPWSVFYENLMEKNLPIRIV